MFELKERMSICWWINLSHVGDNSQNLLTGLMLPSAEALDVLWHAKPSSATMTHNTVYCFKLGSCWKVDKTEYDRRWICLLKWKQIKESGELSDVLATWEYSKSSCGNFKVFILDLSHAFSTIGGLTFLSTRQANLWSQNVWESTYHNSQWSWSCLFVRVPFLSMSNKNLQTWRRNEDWRYVAVRICKQHFDITFEFFAVPDLA